MYDLLKGVKIVDLTSAMAAPTGTKLLCEWGAEVIHVEPRNGDMARGPMSAFDWFNTHKKGICLDLKSPEGMEALHKLIAQSDVLVTNFRTEALQKLQLDYETVSAKYPRLIYGHLTGFGTAGPDVNRPGFDTTAYLSRAGFGIDFSENAAVPTILYQGIGDLTTGVCLAAGVAAALYKQKSTGKGEKVNVSLYGTGVYMQALQFMDVQRGNTFPRTRMKPKFSMANTYQSKDGEWFVISVFNPGRDAARLLKFFGKEDLIEKYGWKKSPDYYTREATEILTPVLDEGFRQYNLSEILQFLDENDLPYEVLRHIKDILTDEQAWANEFLLKFENVYGNTEIMPAAPVKFGGKNEAVQVTLAPKLGEDTAEVLKSIGYTDEQIKALEEKGAIGINLPSA